MEITEKSSLSSEVNNFLEYLCGRNYSKVSMSHYRIACENISRYFQENLLLQYDEDVCKQYCEEILDGRDYSELILREKTMLRCANFLLEFMETGAIIQKIKRTKGALSGLCAASINEFLAILESQYMAERTLESYKLYLGRFNDYFVRRGVKNLKDITPELILGYVSGLNYHGNGSGYRALSVTKIYLRFLHENGYLENDYTHLTPSNGTYKKQAKIPSLYTEEEISKMLEAVERSNPKGKRDYAMILLASYLGLRASDICQLQFDEIDWEHDTISLVQKKTKQRVELPLLPQIGNAIIDYLKYGRPKSESNYVFLQLIPNYTCITVSTFYCIVKEYILRAGISTDNSLRFKHSAFGGFHLIEFSYISGGEQYAFLADEFAPQA